MKYGEEYFVTIDIETKPRDDAAMRAAMMSRALAKGPKVQDNWKPETIAQKRQEWEDGGALASVSDQIENKGALEPHLAQIITIGWAVNGEAVTVGDMDNERDLLMTFADALSEMPPHKVMVGHNILGFDLPMLAARMMCHGLGHVAATKIVPHMQGYMGRGVHDTMRMWGDGKGFIAFDLLHVALFGVPGKTGNGAECHTWDRQARVDYNRNDVERERAAFCAMSGWAFDGMKAIGPESRRLEAGGVAPGKSTWMGGF